MMRIAPRLIAVCAVLLAMPFTSTGWANASHDGGTFKVYISPNPTLYHRWECPLLQRPFLIPLAQAAERYERCTTCQPPEPGGPSINML